MSSYGDLSVHRWMLRDAIRNDSFRRALSEVVKPGAVVLDLGAGTGILSVFAAAAGAKRVYAVERTGTAEVARKMVERNGYKDVIQVIESNVEDADLPDKVDVLVSEWMGGFGVDENMLAPVVIARNRWLKPGGVMVPGRVTALLAPAQMPDFDASVAHWRTKPHGVDMEVIARMSTQETYHTQAYLETGDLLAEPQIMWSHDPYTVTLREADEPFIAKVSFIATRAGMVSGFVAWFTADMINHELTNAVGMPDTHWGRTLFPLDRPVEVSAGARFDVELHCDPSLPGSCEMSWNVSMPGRPVEHHDTRRNRQRLGL